MRRLRGSSRKREILDKIKKSNALLEKIHSHVKSTNTQGLEHGFFICENDHYSPEHDCIGTSCEISIPVNLGCRKGMIIGDHHTHPMQIESVASLPDLIHLINFIGLEYLPQYSFTCITGSYNQETVCYIPKKMIDQGLVLRSYDEYNKYKKGEIKSKNHWLYDLFDRIYFRYKPT